jgi:hypothetical protein
LLIFLRLESKEDRIMRLLDVLAFKYVIGAPGIVPEACDLSGLEIEHFKPRQRISLGGTRPAGIAFDGERTHHP